ncbi:MAG TPA: alpha/beta fold hydrolase [Verrucomicrobiota bacterium]|nr:alpha/beta fold hydrolase [Verrucomicrobiota bacterium]
MRAAFCSVLLAVLAPGADAAAGEAPSPVAEGLGTAGTPQAALAELRRLLPASAPWERWLERTGELPPAFDQLPARRLLPDPLRFEDGRAIRRRGQWPARRAELLRLFEHYVTGAWPPAPAWRVAERRVDPGAHGVAVESVTLEFGPGYQARLHLDLMLPGRGYPAPVFLTQENHRRWAAIAVSRGYVGVVYAGADVRDDTGDWVALWPEADWTKLQRRAWAASRCLDYLETRPEVDAGRIALTGHSRNGKTALMAAAFDDRIAAVISSSSGAGGACPYRWFSEAQFGEGIELITRSFPDWLHPRLRFFVGREHRLPIDQHELVACIAPRRCLISTALNDNVESAWAVEQTYHAALPVFRLLGVEDHLGLRYRDGPHATRAEDIEAYLDWLDAGFGRRKAGKTMASTGPSAPVFPTYAEWQKLSGEPGEPRRAAWRGRVALGVPAGPPAAEGGDGGWDRARAELLERVGWVLGDAPPLAAVEAGAYGAEPKPVATLLNRATPPSWLHKESLNFGNAVTGDLYHRTNVLGTDRRLPVLIWLHPISVSHGYTAGYFRGEQPHVSLARSGCAVFAFDQIGNGSRIAEVRDFYRRYPRWSLLGKTVADVRAAVDALERHPRVDPAQIFLVGYGVGGWVAMHAAAVDSRVAGVVSLAGALPLRADGPGKPSSALATVSRLYPLAPRLGTFVGREDQMPYTDAELMALIAPRPLLVITPGLTDRSEFDELRSCVEEARQVYARLGAGEALVFQRTDDYHRFSPELIWCLCGVETVR